MNLSTVHIQASNQPNNSSRRIWGIVTRRERWGISARGWFLLGCLTLLVMSFMLLNVHPFLAETERVDARILVVEGWVYESGIRTAIEEFKTGHYERVFTTGGPPNRAGAHSSDQ